MFLQSNRFVSLGSLCLAAAFVAGGTSGAQAQVAGGRVLFGVQPSTGKILTVNPLTGTVGTGFTAPGTLGAADTLIGLSGAESGNVLIYRDATASNASNNTLFRINPLTGATLSTHTADGYNDDGLSYENNGGDRIIYSHSNSDTHVQLGYGGTTTFFFTPSTPVGALGGDGLGRDFGNFTDGTIKEFNGAGTGTSTTITNSFTAPATTIQGLAFDGVSLYASTSTGLLYTLNPNTGAVIRSVTVQNGALFGLGTAVPEPVTGVAALGAVIGLIRPRRRSNR